MGNKSAAVTVTLLTHAELLLGTHRRLPGQTACICGLFYHDLCMLFVGRARHIIRQPFGLESCWFFLFILSRSSGCDHCQRKFPVNRIFVVEKSKLLDCYQDIFFLHQRAQKVSFFVLGIYGGNSLGTVISGFIVQGKKTFTLTPPVRAS